MIEKEKYEAWKRMELEARHAELMVLSVLKPEIEEEIEYIEYLLAKDEK